MKSVLLLGAIFLLLTFLFIRETDSTKQEVEVQGKMTRYMAAIVAVFWLFLIASVYFLSWKSIIAILLLIVSILVMSALYYIFVKKV
ncbi:MAG: hypothetical protein ACLUD1_04410 [Clostridia bacterium]